MEKKEEGLFLCIGCGMCLSTLIFVAGIISYIVFGIIFLAQDYNIAHECVNSSLWAYVCTALVLSFCRLGAKKEKENTSERQGTQSQEPLFYFN